MQPSPQEQQTLDMSEFERSLPLVLLLFGGIISFIGWRLLSTVIWLVGVVVVFTGGWWILRYQSTRILKVLT